MTDRSTEMDKAPPGNDGLAAQNASYVTDSGGMSHFSAIADLMRSRRALAILGILLLVFLVFTFIKAQATAKSILDNNSNGVDQLNIAFHPGLQSQREDALYLAAQEFTRLDARLNSWSWIINASKIVPPLHDQFAAMDRMADLGSRMSAVSVAANGGGQLAEFGSPQSICASAERLISFDRSLIGQIDKNRTQMLGFLHTASQGQCDSDG